MSRSILDLMPKEEAEKAIARAQKRMERSQSQKGMKISPEVYMVAEFGYYYGWDAVLAIRRGYTLVPGTNEKEVFTLEEAQVLLEGARKVWYSKLVETSGVQVASNKFTSASNSYAEAIKPYTDKSDLG